MPNTRNTDCKCEELVMKMMSMFQEFMKMVNDREDKRMELEKERFKMEQKRFEIEQEERKRMREQEEDEKKRKLRLAEEAKQKALEEKQKVNKEKELEIERIEREQRSTNIIVSGLKVSSAEDANEEIATLFEKIKCTEKFDARRIGTNKILLKLDNIEIKRKVMAKKYELRGMKDAVYFNDDLTRSQQSEAKNLRDERRKLAAENPNKKVFIYKGMVRCEDMREKSQ